VPMKCKIFMWLAVHTVGTTFRNAAVLIMRPALDETYTHLFVHCRFSHQVWRKVRDWTKADFPIPNNNFPSTEEW
jgi:hypothetical protein